MTHYLITVDLDLGGEFKCITTIMILFFIL